DPRAIVELEAALAAAERQGLGWLARVGRAAFALAGPLARGEYTPADAAAMAGSAAREEDRWGEAIADLAEGWSRLADEDSALPALDTAAGRFRALGAGTLEAWARSLAALVLARVGAPESRDAGFAAEAMARSTVAPGPRLFAHLALARSDPVHRQEHLALVEAALDETGLRLPQALRDELTLDAGEETQAAPTAGAPVSEGGASDGGDALTIRAFGRFEMAVGDRPLDLGSLKPRPRALLRLLALNAGRPVHREVLIDALWPEADPDTAARSLHVALSALRHELQPGGNRRDGELLVRDGDAYRIELPPGSHVDLIAFERAVAAGQAARSRGEDEAAIAALRMALAEYAGELLPEDGPADWVVAVRERTRADAVEVARCLAELLEARPEDAAAVCTTGLGIDPYHDPLWRLLIEARERAGDQAAASSARAAYARMLRELGVSEQEAGEAAERAATAGAPT
ncbi:MAG: transcriptional regulator, family, partial [Chloroflexi bacterium]|nr:transcriptional regulator, family [Chloroflexota bacterium]